MAIMDRAGSLCFLAVLPLFLAACTAQDVYEELKRTSTYECNQLSPNQREECLAHLPPDYEIYKREREEILQE